MMAQEVPAEQVKAPVKDDDEEKISIIKRDDEVPGLGGKTEEGQPGERAVDADGSLTTLRTLSTLDFYLVFIPFIFAAGVRFTRAPTRAAAEPHAHTSTPHTGGPACHQQPGRDRAVRTLYRNRASRRTDLSLCVRVVRVVVRSLDGGSMEKNLYVAGLSVFGCIGRFAVGSLSDRMYLSPRSPHAATCTVALLTRLPTCAAG
jgi:hypothetical protein